MRMNIFRSLYLFALNSLKSLVVTIRKRLRHSTLQAKYGECVIAPTSLITDTVLDDHVVVFDNVILSDCSIGSHSYIQKDSRIFNAIIGNFCSIASRVTIAPGAHPIFGVSTHPAFFLKNTPLALTFADQDYVQFSRKVTVGHDVWIGESAIILDGVAVGTGAIIAAGSVVTKDVAPYAIVGGIPAKLIKYRFSERIIAELLQSEWWNYPDRWFAANYKSMHDIADFLLCIRPKN
jgi:acetyltransferase-like isoleucine patch superfamily enzyme